MECLQSRQPSCRGRRRRQPRPPQPAECQQQQQQRERQQRALPQALLLQAARRRPHRRSWRRSSQRVHWQPTARRTAPAVSDLLGGYMPAAAFRVWSLCPALQEASLSSPALTPPACSFCYCRAGSDSDEGVGSKGGAGSTLADQAAEVKQSNSPLHVPAASPPAALPDSAPHPPAAPASAVGQ